MTDNRRSPGNVLKPLFTIVLTIIPVAVMGLLPSPAPAETWTLDRVLEVARQADPVILAAQARAEAQRSDGHHTLRSLSPRIHLTASANRTDDPALIFTQKLQQGRFTAGDFGLETLNNPDAQTGIRWGFDLRQPLWNDGREVTSPSLSKNLQQAADAGEAAAISDRVLMAVATYVDAVRARQAVQADSVGLAAARLFHSAAVDRYQQGLVPELDTLRATTRLAGAQANQLSSEKNLAIALERLSQLVETPVTGSELGELPDLGGSEMVTVETDTLWEVRAAQGQAGALNVSATRAGLSLLPSVNLRFSYNQYIDPDGSASAWRYAGWLLLDLPVWDALDRVNKWKASKARAREAEADVVTVQRQMEIRALSARKEKEISVEYLRTAELARSSSDEALRIALDRYREGLLPISEWSSTEADAARARQDYVNAQAEVVVAHYRYLRAIGRLQ
jgi:outer membrane protein TolC